MLATLAAEYLSLSLLQTNEAEFNLLKNCLRNETNSNGGGAAELIRLVIP